MYPPLVYHVHELAFHLIVYRPVAAERPAALHMPGHGGDEVGVRYLSVQVANKGLACRVAAGHLIQWFLYGVVSMRVKYGHHTVYAAVFQQIPYAQVIGMDGFERKKSSCISAIAFQYSLRLGMQRNPYDFCLALLGLLGHIFQESVLDVVSREPVQVAHATAYIAVEDEDVTDGGQFRVVAQIRIIQDVPLFGSEVERISIGRFLASVEGIDLVVGIFHFLAPVQEGTEEIHYVDDGRVGKRPGLVVDEHAGSIEIGVFLPQQVFIRDIIPEIIHLLQSDSF